LNHLNEILGIVWNILDESMYLSREINQKDVNKNQKLNYIYQMKYFFQKLKVEDFLKYFIL
jgi:hypothetical protein